MINHPQINSNSIFIAPWGLCESHIATATGLLEVKKCLPSRCFSAPASWCLWRPSVWPLGGTKWRGLSHDRRKFRSQTSDNMDRWKADMWRGREKRKIRRKKSRRERVRRKKIQVREKVGKSRNTVFFQWFVAPEGRKVGSLKPAIWPDERWKIARSQNVQNTPAPDHYWKLRCRKNARRCGAKHISKSKCTKHTSSGPLWKLRCRKSARRCGAKHISKSKC